MATRRLYPLLFALIVTLGGIFIPLPTFARPDALPQPPTLTSPADWTSVNDASPTLCASSDDDAAAAFQFQVEGAQAWTSDWTSDSCVTPLSLAYGGYRWRARVRDAVGAVSAWSKPWHFHINSSDLVFSDIHFDPPSPSAENKVKVFACTEGMGHTGITLKVSVNDAVDGSDSGVWHVLNELGAYCYTEWDAPIWTTSEYAAGQHLFRFQARSSEHPDWERATTEYRIYTLLPYNGPQPPELLAPTDHATLTSSTVRFQWSQAENAARYHLLVSENPDPEKDSVVDVWTDAATHAFTATLPARNADYFWRVIAENDAGRAHSLVHQFTLWERPADQIHTLILFPRDRMARMYGEPDVTQLEGALNAFAAEPRVQGVVIDLSAHAQVRAAYDQWDAEPLNVVRANAVAEAIKQWGVAPALTRFPQAQTLILVGNDDVLPFRRLPDPTRFSERRYGAISPDSRIGAALSQGYFLSDDYYASLIPRQAASRDFYLPDMAMGRLVETPADIIHLLNAFLTQTPVAGPALITGYDFMQDAGSIQAQLLQTRQVTRLVGGDWDAAKLRAMLDAGPWSLLALNQHANHWGLGAPQGEDRLTSADVRRAPSLTHSLTLSPGCQAGLNAPDSLGDEDHPLDLPQAFLAAGGAFMGNTGFGWGVRGSLGYSERLTTYVISNLLDSPQRTLGEAMLAAKRDYWIYAGELDALDEKVLQEFTLYGIPLARPQLAAKGRAISHPTTPEPAVIARPQGLTRDTLSLQSDLRWEEVAGADGVPSYYAYHRDKRYGVWLKSGWPAQPQSVMVVQDPYVHGVVFVEGRFTDVTDRRPFVAYAENEVLGADRSNQYPLWGWTPARPVALRAIDDSHRAMTVFFGQERLGVMRLYDEVTLYKYASDIDDWTPPRIESVASDVQGDEAVIRVIAGDDREMHEVWLTYTEDRVAEDGQWRSVAMHETASGLWSATIPIARPARYMVQAVDAAGNVTVADNDGAYFRAPAAPGSIGLHCGGVGPLGEDYCACLWGVVWVDGEPALDAQVTLTFDGESLEDTTAWKAMEDVPYYDISGQELGVKEGDVFTLTVRYQDVVATQRVIARPDDTGEQRFDLFLGRTPHLWLPMMRR